MTAEPTDGLWGDNRTDESQIGASYDEIEVSSPPESLIYNRLLELGSPSISDYDISGDITGVSVTNFDKTIQFANAWSIDQPIHGEMLVGSFDEDDRKPVPSDFTAPTFTQRYLSAGPYMYGPMDSRRRDRAFRSETAAGYEEFGVGHVATAMFLNASHQVAYGFHGWSAGSEVDIGGLLVYMTSIKGYTSEQEVYSGSNMMGMTAGTEAVAAHGFEGSGAADMGGSWLAPRVSAYAYMIEIMMYIAGGMESLGFDGDRGLGLFNNSSDHAAARAGSASRYRDYSSLARKAGKNIRGLNAQSLLYIIRNEIYPVTDKIDNLLEDNTSGDTLELYELLQDVSYEDVVGSLTDIDVALVIDHTGWSPVDIVWSTGVHWDNEGLMEGSAPLGTYSFRGYNYDADSPTIEFSYEGLARYYSFRSLLAQLHNALLYMILEMDEYLGSGGTGVEIGYGITTEADMPVSENEFHTMQIVRGYLDATDHRGPDLNDLLQDGEFDGNVPLLESMIDKFDLNLPTNIALGDGIEWKTSTDWRGTDDRPSDMEEIGYTHDLLYIET